MNTLVNPSAFPEELRLLNQWVNFRLEKRDDGRLDKIPCRADGTAMNDKDEKNWLPFDAAVANLNNGGKCDGVGFAFKDGDDLVGWDFDHCLDKIGRIKTKKVEKAVQTLNSYTEVTPSQFGLHVFCRGPLPVTGTKKDDFEVYRAKRFFTVTGFALPGYPATVERRDAEVPALYAKLFKKKSRKDQPKQTQILPGGLDAALEVEKYRAIYESDSLEKDQALGYPSGSEADMAITAHLRQYGDVEQVTLWLKASPRAVYRKKKFKRDAYLSGTAEKVTPKKPTIAQQLAEVAFRGELFHDDRRDTYSHFENQTLPLKGREFKRHLIDTYQREYGKHPGSDAVLRAISGADAKASRRGHEYKLEVRFANNDDGYWLDLCDGRAVLTTAKEWRIVERPPILFRRWAHQAPLPEPLKSGGDLRRISRFLNVTDEDDLLLIYAWLVGATVAGIPRPALDLHGPKGTGKSNTTLFLRQTIDPSRQEGQDLPSKPAEFAQLLDHNAVAVFDNLSHIVGWQSNLLCRAVTGEAFNKRELYTDADDVMFLFRRTFLMNGINVATAQPDLLDRLILIELRKPEHRVEEAQLKREFEIERPAILGGLLDTLRAALELRTKIKVEDPPRMADFSNYGAAAAEALGYGADRFLQTYQRNIGLQNEEVIASDPVANALITTIPTGWEGTIAELKAKLEARNPHIERSKSWPKDATRLSRHLNTVIPALESQGVEIEHSPRGKQRLIRITGTEGKPDDY